MVLSKFQNQAADYDQWFDRHPALFQSELAAIRSLLPALKKAWKYWSGPFWGGKLLDMTFAKIHKSPFSSVIP